MKPGDVLRLAVAATLAAGCGYVGDPLPPALLIPVPVKDLTAIERGDKIVAEFYAGGETLDGILLDRYGEVDLRIGSEGVAPFHRAGWEDNAVRLAVPDGLAPGSHRVETDAAPWAGRTVMVGVRLANPRGRWSDWSNSVVLEVVAPVPAPGSVTAESLRDGVRLSWKSGDTRPGLRYRISRREQGHEERIVLAETDAPEYLDGEVAFGASYEYAIQTLAPAGDGVAESDWSAPAALLRQDLFPPAPPSGLAAVAGLGSIELAWELAEESDLDHYRLYRSVDDAPMQLEASELNEPRYSDRAISAGTRYRYAVTAVDQSGNESAHSQPAELVAP